MTFDIDIFVSDIAIFVLKRDVKLQLTYLTYIDIWHAVFTITLSVGHIRGSGHGSKLKVAGGTCRCELSFLSCSVSGSVCRQYSVRCTLSV